MKKTKPNQKKTKTTHQIVKEIIEAWNLHNEVDRNSLLPDIEAALNEAYMRGAHDASKDKKLLEKALDFVDGL